MLFLSKGAHETSSDRGAKKTRKKTNTKTQTSQLSMQLKKEKKKKKTDIVYNIWEERVRALFSQFCTLLVCIFQRVLE